MCLLFFGLVESNFRETIDAPMASGADGVSRVNRIFCRATVKTRSLCQGQQGDFPFFSGKRDFLPWNFDPVSALNAVNEASRNMFLLLCAQGMLLSVNRLSVRVPESFSLA